MSASMQDMQEVRINKWADARQNIQRWFLDDHARVKIYKLGKQAVLQLFDDLDGETDTVICSTLAELAGKASQHVSSCTLAYC